MSGKWLNWALKVSIMHQIASKYYPIKTKPTTCTQPYEWMACTQFHNKKKIANIYLYNFLRPNVCVSKFTIIAGRRQAIIWTNDGILLIRHLGTNFNEIIIKIYIFSFKKIHLKLSSGYWHPFCVSLNVISHWIPTQQWLYCLILVITRVPTVDTFDWTTHYTPRNEVSGGGGGVGGGGVGVVAGVYWIHPVCLSVRLSVCLSACLSICLSVD